MDVIIAGRLIQILQEFHDATPVWIAEDNLLYRVEIQAKETSYGYGIVLQRGEKVFQ